MIELKRITEDNMDQVIALEVGEGRQSLIETTNLRSIADAYVLNADGIPATPFAIYVDEVVVGFLMYTYDTTDHESFQNEVYFGEKVYFLYHFMIGKRYQEKGYGKLAVEKTLAKIKQMPLGEAKYIDLFYHRKNLVAKKIYASLGFVDSGIIQGDSVHASKKL
ncbi:GNAT family N-acetyltransferase [Shouchella sp. JSM 1781072]|uniref:GNAT family N-acetyltransferase n=1 Tax=Bacillaceae TaxID=186817 RepID=UPI000C07DFC5|nr:MULTISPECIES: GNAT family N-acetyltransferase [Bacillaceae]UTR07118.1 GNAT family N-acetyltransferase [Alkalihalobacillus sp. LMS6]